ncbi:metallophosphoesterase [Sinomonas sp. ASV486]|uniref:metallophosphoesterase n=1 Tax=Sinomonas sp. ASV486 TaxID=3051170 RepID=UPI0027DD7387|nr:metallophosphoesterase [Sinomonas sp. ASV486]MDQ4491014.1 metallophosphoesterase [Sinomonas sp. ASV486]
MPASQRRARIAAVSAALALTAAVATTAAATASPAPQPSPQHAAQAAKDAFSFAVIGDTPYGAGALAAFPSHVAQLNADKSLDFVVHVGDIKNGSDKCSNEYFDTIRADFDQFTHPLIYTIGDNEWTDCHRTSNGAYNPLERLARLREVFFDEPGKTLGATMPVTSQADLGIPEDVAFTRNRVAFAAVNVPGSNNSMLPWTGLGKTAPTPEQVAEVQHRTDAVIVEIKKTFAEARQRNDRTVVVLQQADMFDPTYNVPWTDISAFTPIVQTLIDEASAFSGDVYLFNGDSHVYNADRPLAVGSPWLSKYGVTGSAHNLQRITIDGSAKATNYLRVDVAGNGSAGKDQPILSWDRVSFK